MADEVIHLASPAVYFGSVKVQRCGWCGVLIEHRDFSRMAVAVDPTASAEVQGEEARRAGSGEWEGLVGVTDGFPRILRSVDDPEDGWAPDNSCMVLGLLEVERGE